MFVFKTCLAFAEELGKSVQEDPPGTFFRLESTSLCFHACVVHAILICTVSHLTLLTCQNRGGKLGSEEFPQCHMTHKSSIMLKIPATI